MAAEIERIGIYGGTFDPVHNGHLILARDAVERLGLSKMIFIPAAISPHKLAQQPGAPEASRLQMLMESTKDETRFTVDDRELRRAGPSYAFDTVQELRAGQRHHCEWFYLIGEDNVAALNTWHRIGELRDLVTFVVFRRPGYIGDAAANDFPALDRLVDISSTEIRKRVASGRSIRYLVPEAVVQIIAAQQFYHRQPGAEPLPPKN